MKYQQPFHIHISTIFLTLILLVGSIIGGLGYKISHDILESSASELSTRIGSGAASSSRARRAAANDVLFEAKTREAA